MVGVTVYCDACGAGNRASAAFCTRCGQKMPLPAQVAAPNAAWHLPQSGHATGFLPLDHVLNGRYRVLGTLGRGGMGAVYKAEDMRFGGRLVAVKEMSQNGLSPQEIAEAEDAFRHEALMLAKVHHPSIPSIYDHFGEAGHWYLVMDYIEGETLEAQLQLAAGHRLPVSEVLRIGEQLCTVLDYLHSQNPAIVFRDLKPSNIMLSHGHLYLIDYGIARLFKPGQTKDTISMGSPGYAAPEQYGKTQTTARSDIYSLGATLHQCLTSVDPSVRPFHFDSPSRLNSQLPPRLSDLVMRMVQLDAWQRPASASDVLRELRAIDSAHSSAGAPNAPYQVRAPGPGYGAGKPRWAHQAPMPPRSTAFSRLVFGWAVGSAPALTFAVIVYIAVQVSSVTMTLAVPAWGIPWLIGCAGLVLWAPFSVASMVGSHRSTWLFGLLLGSVAFWLFVPRLSGESVALTMLLFPWGIAVYMIVYWVGPARARLMSGWLLLVRRWVQSTKSRLRAWAAKRGPAAASTLAFIARAARLIKRALKYKSWPNPAKDRTLLTTVVVAVVGLALACQLVVTLSNLYRSTFAHSPQPTSATMLWPNGIKQYIDPSYSLRYPGDWHPFSLTTTVGTSTCFGAPSSEDSQLCIEITPGAETPKQADDSLIAFLETTPDGNAVPNTTKVPIVPANAYFAGYEWTRETAIFKTDMLYHTDTYVVVTNAIPYGPHSVTEVVYVAPLTSFATQDSEYFSPMLHSLAIVPPAAAIAADHATIATSI